MSRLFTFICVLLALSIDSVYAQDDLTQLPSVGYNQIDLTEQNEDGEFRSFILRGNATRSSDFCYQVTEDQGSQRGRTWWPDRISLEQNFRMDFVIFAGAKNADGADGYAFVLQNDPRGTDAIGRPGKYVGLGGAVSRNPIMPSLAVEIDTYQNVGFAKGEFCNRVNLSRAGDRETSYNDPFFDHLSLIEDGATGCPLTIYSYGLEGQAPNFRPVILDAGAKDVQADALDSNIEDVSVCPRFTVTWDYLSRDESAYTCVCG